MYKNTKNAMIKYASTLKASYERAQCYTISSYKLIDKETIADVLEKNHRSQDGALIAADLMVQAGCAKEINKKNDLMFGTYVFEDGSTLN